jgi:hypothetical protein
MKESGIENQRKWRQWRRHGMKMKSMKWRIRSNESI